jgi:hypothetical protein
MYLPDFDVETITDDYELDNSTDKAIQAIYDTAAEAIEEHLGVEVLRPTTHDVSFKYQGASVDLRYAETGEERFTIVDDGGNPQTHSEEEFAEQLDEESLQRLKKAVTIFSKIVEAQQMCVSQDVLEKYV